ncbi:MAG: hypothetical protein M3P43_16965 [Actinomycetota bacterium]|nr:hypothetical protein [Actinomycetota bacterium]
MRRRHGWAVVALALVASCASGGGNPSGTVPPASGGSAASDLPILPADALPGYVVHVADLDAATLSADALDPSSLDVVLAGAGFETGIERRFTARWKPVTEVVVRALRFASPDGASTYLAWLRTHAADVLGSQTQVSDPPSFADAIAFTHAPCTSCTKDTFQYFAAWTHGQYALTLLVGGPRAGRSTATPLAEELDARVSDDG